MNYTYAYARVSTQEQKLDTQLDTLERDGYDKLYVEKISGSVTIRPQLELLLAALRPGDTVKVARFFRLGRNTRHLLEIIEGFNRDNITFIALDMKVDTRTPGGKLVVTVLAGLAQFQLEDTAEKTAHGRVLAAAAGTHMGRKAGPDKVKLAKVRQCIDAGMSNSQIVTLSDVSLASVKRYRKILSQAKGLE